MLFCLENPSRGAEVRGTFGRFFAFLLAGILYARSGEEVG